MDSRLFCYEDLTIRVRCEDAAHLIWLEEFLVPQFQVSHAQTWHHDVTYLTDEPRYNDMLSRGTTGEQVIGFTLDNSVIRLPTWRSSETERVIYDEPFKLFYIVQDDASRITLLHQHPTPLVRTPLMRVIRELAMNHGWQRGGLFIHGSAFTINQRSVMMVGPKRSGKTTLLMHTLRHPMTQYISNDRVFVKFETSGAILRGMPTIVAIRQPTTDMFPNFKQHLTTSGFHYRQSRFEPAVEPAVPQGTHDPKYSLNPLQFCQLVGTTSVQGDKAHALIFPHVTHAPGMIELDCLPAEVAAESLQAALFSAATPDKCSEVFIQSTAKPPPTQSDLESLCRQLTSQLSCYTCRLGTEAYCHNESVAAFIRQVA